MRYYPISENLTTADSRFTPQRGVCGSHLSRHGSAESEQLVSLESLLQGGKEERGRTSFEIRAGCANSHRVAGHGGLIGPDLTKIGAIRAGRDLIESIVMPSATFAQDHDSYTATFGNADTTWDFPRRSVP